MAAIGGAAFGLVPAAIAFAAGVLACMALRVVPPRRVYDAIDWPVIVLVAALIPVAGAMATTGAADVDSPGVADRHRAGTSDHRTGVDFGRHHDPIGLHEQRRYRRSHVPDCDWHCKNAGGQF